MIVITTIPGKDNPIVKADESPRCGHPDCRNPDGGQCYPISGRPMRFSGVRFKLDMWLCHTCYNRTLKRFHARLPLTGLGVHAPAVTPGAPEGSMFGDSRDWSKIPKHLFTEAIVKAWDARDLDGLCAGRGGDPEASWETA